MPGGGDKVKKNRRARRRGRTKKQLQQQKGQENTENPNQTTSIAPTQVLETAPEMLSHMPMDRLGSSAGEVAMPSSSNYQPQDNAFASSLSHPISQSAPRHLTQSQRKRVGDQMLAALRSGVPSQQSGFAQVDQSRQYGTMAPNRLATWPPSSSKGVYEGFQKLSLSPPGAQSPLQGPAGQFRESYWTAPHKPKKTDRVKFVSPQKIAERPALRPRFADRSIDDIEFVEKRGKARKPDWGQDTEIKLEAPVPSPEYLQLANEPTALVEKPEKRQLLIILDLNGTLFYRNRLRNGKKDKLTPVARPGLSSFFQYIFREHHVVFFSSAMQATVLSLLQSILQPTYRSKVARIFTREDMGIPEQYYHHKVSTFKRLTMVWRSLKQHHHTWDFSQCDTILLDDSPDKATSEPHNHLMVPEYTQDLHMKGGDWVLRRAAGYIEEARKWDNVSSYMRTNPFDATKEYEPPAGWEDFTSDLPAPIRKIARVPPEETAKFHERYQQDVAQGVAKPYSIRGLIADNKNA
ncbi:hypothetical protein ABW21_db0201599 [Orbilia brochopaga]|nr:hypothetical protein ABW21_db0201599 [Drechslerella brochopaga]